ncbi:MAG TPA: ABC transporter permease [Candidatus Deferrimicrobium sp.]|nr:ABC transporter permease [Candidatus Deferrimicrobium sp.]
MDISQETPAAFRSTGTRPGPIGLLGEAIHDVRSRWRLIRYLAQADLKRKGADTLFGNLWWVLDPVLQMAVYGILVTIVFQRSQEAYPLFIFAALLPWKWLSTVISDAITSVTGQERLIKQIAFPKIILPTAAMISGTAHFVFGLVPLAIMLLVFYSSHISAYLVLIPVVAAVQFVFTLAIGLIVAALNVFFRDVGNLARHVLRLWFYLSPALYGADTIAALSEHHPTISAVMRINPMFAILESYRDVIYYGRLPDFGLLAAVLAASAVLLVFGTIFFKRLEPAFAKVL